MDEIDEKELRIKVLDGLIRCSNDNVIPRENGDACDECPYSDGYYDGEFVSCEVSLIRDCLKILQGIGGGE